MLIFFMIQRIYVHESVYDAFINKFVAIAKVHRIILVKELSI